ncbi:MAG: hypothetical protein ACRCUI_02365 [Polymorphobacter sp.]
MTIAERTGRCIGHFAVALLLAVPTLAVAQEAAKPAAPPAVAVPVEATVATVAGANAEPKVVAAKPDPKDPDAIVCKWETDSGSRIKATKHCASRRQWAESGREISKTYQNQGNAQSQ